MLINLLQINASSFFEGEQIIYAVLGKSFIISAALSLVFSFFFYVKSINKPEKNLTKIASTLYLVHLFLITCSVAIFYYLIFSHRFEYAYVWQYTSKEMPLGLLISSFWAGQEGSFLLWVFIQAIVGAFLLNSALSWKKYVMPVFIVGHFFLLTMLLGVEIMSVQIGISPFRLLRELPQNIDLDFFKQADYLSGIVNGNGLNPLLENIWMIVHPPALFIGYAIILVPFSYAFASLIKKDYTSWLQPTKVWVLISIFSLGIGIILGARWAYESLTFGGFWAWDPVENASLVPWMFLIAALHSLIISRKKSQAFKTSYILVFLSWFFVIYATFLTRSGVLGDTSVHSFAPNVLSTQMIVITALILIVPIILLFVRRKDIPKNKNKEIFLSREFWIVIAITLIIVSACQIANTTSIPVINLIFKTNIAPPNNPIEFYNQWQIFFAVAFLLLIIFTQKLKYGENKYFSFRKKFLLDILVSLVISVGLFYFFRNKSIPYLILTFSSVLLIVSTIRDILKNYKSLTIGGLLTHLGFGIFILGIIVAFGQNYNLSGNVNESESKENIFIEKNNPIEVGKYILSYTNEVTKGNETFYKIDFHSKKNKSKYLFSVYPSVNRNQQMGYVFNPDTKHFFNKDIYVYLIQTSEPNEVNTLDKVKEFEIGISDNFEINNNTYTLKDIKTNFDGKDIDNVSIEAIIAQLSSSDTANLIKISFNVVDGVLNQQDAILDDSNTMIRFENLSETSSDIVIGQYNQKQKYVVIKNLVFPYISILWLGVFIIFVGLLISIIKPNLLLNEKKD